jgi:hypothetical protein
MPKEPIQSVEKLPDTPEFWTPIGHPNMKDFVNASLFDEIRSMNPCASHLELTAFVSRIQTMVRFIDDPKTISNNKKAESLEEQIRREEEELIS